MSFRALVNSPVKLCAWGTKHEDVNPRGALRGLCACGHLLGHPFAGLETDFKRTLHARPIALEEFKGGLRVKSPQHFV